jgi:hypothetical protein
LTFLTIFRAQFSYGVLELCASERGIISGWMSE